MWVWNLGRKIVARIKIEKTDTIRMAHWFNPDQAPIEGEGGENVKILTKRVILKLTKPKGDVSVFSSY